MSDLPADLAGLPEPRLLQELSFEGHVAEMKADLLTFFAELGVPFDAQTLETDPSMAILEVGAYRYMLAVQRGNELYRATFRAFARGGDLDHKANFYDVLRLPGEADLPLNERISLAIRGRSTGGTEPRYEAIARAADVRVKSAVVYRVGRSPLIHVAVFSTEGSGEASPDLVTKVQVALDDPASRMVNDTILARSAVQRVVGVAANVWLLPSASSTVFDDLEARLRSAFAVDADLGFNLTRSWIVSKLMQPGVQRVELTAPTEDVIVPPFEAVALGVVTLTNMGRDY